MNFSLENLFGAIIHQAPKQQFSAPTPKRKGMRKKSNYRFAVVSHPGRHAVKDARIIRV